VRCCASDLRSFLSEHHVLEVITHQNDLDTVYCQDSKRSGSGTAADDEPVLAAVPLRSAQHWPCRSRYTHSTLIGDAQNARSRASGTVMPTGNGATEHTLCKCGAVKSQKEAG